MDNLVANKALSKSYGQKHTFNYWFRKLKKEKGASGSARVDTGGASSAAAEQELPNPKTPPHSLGSPTEKG